MRFPSNIILIVCLCVSVCVYIFSSVATWFSTSTERLPGGDKKNPSWGLRWSHILVKWGLDLKSVQRLIALGVCVSSATAALRGGTLYSCGASGIPEMSKEVMIVIKDRGCTRKYK